MQTILIHTEEAHGSLTYKEEEMKAFAQDVALEEKRLKKERKKEDAKLNQEVIVHFTKTFHF